jgi:hypothetical protein
MSYDERIGKLEEAGLPDEQGFSDGLMQYFNEGIFNNMFSKAGKEPRESYDDFVSEDLILCVDEVVCNDPERWIRRFQHILEDDDAEGLDRDQKTLAYFSDMCKEGGCL